jgi:hypothetical protein
VARTGGAWCSPQAGTPHGDAVTGWRDGALVARWGAPGVALAHRSPSSRVPDASLVEREAWWRCARGHWDSTGAFPPRFSPRWWGMSERRGTCCAHGGCLAASTPCAAGLQGGTNPKPEARRGALIPTCGGLTAMVLRMHCVSTHRLLRFAPSAMLRPCPAADPANGASRCGAFVRRISRYAFLRLVCAPRPPLADAPRAFLLSSIRHAGVNGRLTECVYRVCSVDQIPLPGTPTSQDRWRRGGGGFAGG